MHQKQLYLCLRNCNHRASFSAGTLGGAAGCVRWMCELDV